MKKIGILVLAALISASPLALANSGEHGKCGGGHGSFDEKFFHKAHALSEYGSQVGLTEEQKKGIENLEFEVKKNLVKQDADLELVGLDIKQQMSSGAMDVAAVNKLIDQKYEIKKAKDKYLVGAIGQLKQTLSEEQWAKLKELKSEHHGFSKATEIHKGNDGKR